MFVDRSESGSESTLKIGKTQPKQKPRVKQPSGKAVAKTESNKRKRGESPVGDLGIQADDEGELLTQMDRKGPLKRAKTKTQPKKKPTAESGSMSKSVPFAENQATEDDNLEPEETDPSAHSRIILF